MKYTYGVSDFYPTGPKIFLDVEIYDEWGDGKWAQSKYLVHGSDDVYWCESIAQVLSVFETELEKIG